MIRRSFNAQTNQKAQAMIMARAHLMERRHSISEFFGVREFQRVENVATDPVRFLPESARATERIMSLIQSECLGPHLESKTDLVFTVPVSEYVEHDQKWIESDQATLSRCKVILTRDLDASHPLRKFFLELTDGLLVHTRHRSDILRLNQGKIIPENGPLIRAMYTHAENVSIDVLSKTFSHLRINEESDKFSVAVLRSDARRLVRNLIRVGASRANANLSAAKALETAALTFPERISGAHLRDLATRIKNGDAKEKKELMKPFQTALIELDRTKQATDEWVKRHFLGFLFFDLIEKYMQHHTFQGALEEVSRNSSKPNKEVTAKMEGMDPTIVTQKYVDEISRLKLFKSVFAQDSGVRYNVKK